MHHWAAGVLVLLIGLHILRVFIWGAYRYPRELAWVGGALLFFVVLGFGFTGYLLPWDQKAYWATVVGTNIAGSAPFVGGAVMELLRGGEQLGAVTLTRFYGIHIWVLPATLCGCSSRSTCSASSARVSRHHLGASLWRRQPGESRRDAYEREYAAEKAEGKPFWAALYKDAIVALVVVIAVVAVALVAGAPLEEPANPNSTNYAPRPEWYFLDLFQMLWYFGGSLEPLIIFGLFSLGALIFIAVPFVDRGRARHPRQRPARWASPRSWSSSILTLTVHRAHLVTGRHRRGPARDGMTTTQLPAWRSTTARAAPRATPSMASAAPAGPASPAPGRATRHQTCAGRS